MISNVSHSRLPVTDSGYFSDPLNFAHFAECAQSYMEPAHGKSLVPEDAVTLRLIFEGAAQLGVFDRAKP